MTQSRLTIGIALVLLAAGCGRSRESDSPSTLERPPVSGGAADLSADSAVEIRTPSRASVRPSGFEEVTNGLELFSGDIEGLELFVMRLRLGTRSVQLHAVADPLSGSASLNRYAEEVAALAGISGGFLRSFYPPVPTGRVLVRGEEYSADSEEPLLNGLVRIAATGRSVTIEPFNVNVPRARNESQLQSGPLLVVDGEPESPDETHPRGFWTQARNRAFVALDAQGRLLLGWTGQTTMPSLISAIANADGPFRVRSAVGLSGDITAGILLKVGREVQARGDIATALHNVLLVR